METKTAHIEEGSTKIEFAVEKKQFKVGDAVYFPEKTYNNVVLEHIEEGESKKEFRPYILLYQYTRAIIVDMLPQSEKTVTILTSNRKYTTWASMIAPIMPDVPEPKR